MSTTLRVFRLLTALEVAPDVVIVPVLEILLTPDVESSEIPYALVPLVEMVPALEMLLATKLLLEPDRIKIPFAAVPLVVIRP